jgi:hypothetical protein
MGLVDQEEHLQIKEILLRYKSGKNSQDEGNVQR